MQDTLTGSGLPETVAPPAFAGVEEAVAALAEDRPIHVLYPETLRAAARRFQAGFSGSIMYAVKCNPDPTVLSELAAAGIDRFDVASIAEIEAVRQAAPTARMSFMHPVKNRRAIRHAYLAGVRDFAVDSLDELDKIVEETQAGDLTVFVRLGLPKGQAVLDLSDKFGISGAPAAELLRAARERAARLGVSFHVGSQCMDPAAFTRGVAIAREAVDAAGVTVDSLDVGGGFPVGYPGMNPPAPEAFFSAIDTAVAEYGFDGLPLLCEPGRALVAEGGSLLARVDLRKQDRLYLNDGTYGALFDAGAMGWRYPVRRVSAGGARSDGPLTAFRFFGPTCDSLDAMEGPFFLPADMGEGDWIEIGHLGAYGAAMRTRFNGFHSDLTVCIDPAAKRVRAERSGMGIGAEPAGSGDG